MLPLCDYVIVCVSLTPETYQIIGEKELKLMKPSASLINVSRGIYVYIKFFISEVESLEDFNKGCIKLI